MSTTPPFRILSSTPLRPLSTLMAEHAEACTEMHVATAFVSDAAIDAVLAEAAENGAKVRFLTGTFGKATRKRTFAKLLRLTKRHEHVEVRIWTAGAGGNFHAKMYFWHKARGGSLAWVGSSNFTDGGLQNEGEIIAEVRGPWSSGAVRTVRRAFDHEWDRSEPITDRFVQRYEEAERPPSDSRAHARARPARVTRKRAQGRTRLLNIADYFEADSPVEARVEQLLGGTANDWMYTFQDLARTARDGDKILVVSRPDRAVLLVKVIERRRDDGATVIAYRPLVERRWTNATRSVLAEAGVPITKYPRLPKTRWLDVNPDVLARALRRI